MPSLRERWVNWTTNSGKVGLAVQYILAVSIIVTLGIAGPYLIIAAKYQTFFNPFF